MKRKKKGLRKKVEEGKPSRTLLKKIKKISRGYNSIKKQLRKVIVGQTEVIRCTLIALMCDGHVLLEGVPGLAKSLLVEALARCISGTTFRRIQFVPDMLPADILGVNIYKPGTGKFEILKGPIFANFILADEINRAPPKTQAALMEVMQERKVNIYRYEFKLDHPFLVLATQNPLEQYGVYPLPEAIVDRFFMKVLVDYPLFSEEIQILDQNTIKRKGLLTEVRPVVTKKFILDSQEVVRDIFISPKVKEYIVSLVSTTRGTTEYKIPSLKYVRWGASPRASIWLALGGAAVALLEGREYVLPKDVKTIAKPVLRHRIILNYEGKAKGISTDEIIEEVLDAVTVT